MSRDFSGCVIRHTWAGVAAGQVRDSFSTSVLIIKTIVIGHIFGTVGLYSKCFSCIISFTTMPIGRVFS